jgi:hypothetical protein
MERRHLKLALIIVGVCASIIAALFAVDYWFLAGTSLNECRGCISQAQYADVKFGEVRSEIITRIGQPEAPNAVSSFSDLLPSLPPGERCDYYTAGGIMDSTVYRLCYLNGRLAAKSPHMQLNSTMVQVANSLARSYQPQLNSTMVLCRPETRSHR